MIDINPNGDLLVTLNSVTQTLAHSIISNTTTRFMIVLSKGTSATNITLYLESSNFTNAVNTISFSSTLSILYNRY
jgi:hypothetical protein